VAGGLRRADGVSTSLVLVLIMMVGVFSVPGDRFIMLTGIGLIIARIVGAFIVRKLLIHRPHAALGERPTFSIRVCGAVRDRGLPSLRRCSPELKPVVLVGDRMGDVPGSVRASFRLELRHQLGALGLILGIGDYPRVVQLADLSEPVGHRYTSRLGNVGRAVGRAGRVQLVSPLLTVLLQDPGRSADDLFDILPVSSMRCS
jgi:hypothetical protein